MLSKYLKPEYKDTVPARIAAKFENTNLAHRMTLRVPAGHERSVTHFLKRAVSPEYRFHRRAGGGPRHDSMDLTCRVEDATFFKYYFDRKVPKVVSALQPKRHCSTCGQTLK